MGKTAEVFCQFKNLANASITRKLFIYFVCCGFFFTIFIASFLAYSEYNNAKGTTSDTLEFIRQGYLQPITSSLYKMDEHQLEIELQGVLKLRPIVYVHVRDELGSGFVMSLGVPDALFSSVKEFPLLYDIGGKATRVGTFSITYSMDFVYKKLLKQTLWILLVSTALGSVILIVFLYFFNKIVVRHLLAIADFALKQNLSEIGPKLKLVRPAHKSDELDILVQSFNDMLSRIENDIAERRQTEEKLLKSESNYRSIFENAVEGIFQTTPEGQYVSANPALVRMFGYDSPKELINGTTDLSIQGYVKPEGRASFIETILKQGIITGFETQHYRKDGSIIWISINARVVKDEAGRTLYYEGTIEDITSRKRAEESLHNTLEKLRKSLSSTIQAMSLTVETRDPYTAGHQRRVSSLARAIAQEMYLHNDTVDNIRLAGNVHDIGKISVPAEILSKPGKISDMEFGLIKVHPQSGYDILKGAELPYPIAEIVLQHHERLDGSGYPQGLKGDQILLETKILSVADVVEAIATHRPYRPALGIDYALEEIEKNKGILYDEKVVEVCSRLFKDKGFKFE